MEAAMTYQQIHYSVTGHVACITFNRPRLLNAWTRVMAREIREAFFMADTDGEVRVIVLTGAGRGFCSGADIAELEDAMTPDEAMLKSQENADPENVERIVSLLTGTPTEEELDPGNIHKIRTDFRKRYSYLQGLKKPVIAAVNGPAIGLGLIMALYCDIRFASETARFSTAFSRRGLIAEHGVSWLLPRIVGMANAFDLLLSARLVDAREALGMGLVNRVLPQEGFLETVMEYASMLATQVSPRSLRVMKWQLYEAQFQTLAEAIVAADAALIESLQSEDFKEGVNHFIEKRPPNFTGR